MKEKPVLAQRIRTLRLEHGLTQKELGEKSGLRPQAIVYYENGLREPNSKAMATLEKFFNVTGSYLRGESNQRQFNHDITAPQVEYANNFTQELLFTMKQLLVSINELSNAIKSTKEEHKMKKLLITYQMENENGTAENCIELSMLDKIADDILAKQTESDYVNPTPHGYLYNLLQRLSIIQGYKLSGFCTAELLED